jgi:hypothetical protein
MEIKPVLPSWRVIAVSSTHRHFNSVPLLLFSFQPSASARRHRLHQQHKYPSACDVSPKGSLSKYPLCCCSPSTFVSVVQRSGAMKAPERPSHTTSGLTILLARVLQHTLFTNGSSRPVLVHVAEQYYDLALLWKVRLVFKGCECHNTAIRDHTNAYSAGRTITCR